MDLANYLDPELMAKIQAGGYVLMFVLMIIEGPIVTFISAFLASLGVFDIGIVFFLGFSGDIMGDLIFYTFGYITGKHTKVNAFLNKGIIGMLQNLAKKNLFQALIIIKYTPYLPPIGLSMVGAMHMSFMRYFVTTIGLSVIGPLIFGLSGYYMGTLNLVLPKTFSGIIVLGVIAIIILTVIHFSYKFIMRKFARMFLDDKNGEMS